MALSVAFQTSASDTSNASAYTFSGQAIGAVASDRQVVVIAAVNSNPAAVGAMTATLDYGSGAIAMTRADGASNSTTNACSIALFYLPAPTGNTTGTIVITCAGGTQLRCAIGIWKINGSAFISVLDHGTSTAANPTKTLTTINGGVSIAGAVTDSVGALSWTPTNITEDYDLTVEVNMFPCGDSAADGSSSRAVTLTPTSGALDPVGVFVAFQASTAYSLTAAVGSFTLAGIAALQKIKHFIPTGVYTYTGIAAFQKFTRPAAVGSYVLSSVAAFQKIRHFIPTGSYVISNIAAFQKIVRPAAAGSYMLTGMAALWKITRLIRHTKAALYKVRVEEPKLDG